MEKEENILTTKSSIKEKNIITSVAWIMAALTVLNIGATYGIVQYNNVKTYGSAENYEKAILENSFRYKAMWSIEDVKNEVAKAEKILAEQKWANNWTVEWWNEQLQEEKTGWKLAKEDLVAKAPVYGKENVKYSLYEFSDLECPYCKGFHNSGVAKEAVDKNSDTLNHIVRNFPLEQIHPGARMKAEATLCVAEIAGKDAYTKIMNSIFNEVSSSSKEAVLEVAWIAWADKTKVDECLTSGKYAAAVTSDLVLWEKMWVTWTPSVIIVNNETWEFKKVNGRSVSAIEEVMKSL